MRRPAVHPDMRLWLCTVAFAFAFAALAGCSAFGGAGQVGVLSTVGSPASLHVENRGGPALSIRVNGAEVLQLPCNDARDITPGVNGVPPLPWIVTVARVQSDVVVATQPIADLPQWYLQIGESSLGFGKSAPSGPAAPSCGPGD